MTRLPLVSPLDRALFLKAQHYLDHLPAEILAALASCSEERFFSAGSVVREPGVQSTPVFFLATGAVEFGAPDGVDAPGFRIEAPEAVGLAHLFAQTQFPPGIYAVEDTLLLEIAKRDFEQIIEDHFALFLQVAQANCESTIMLYRELGQDRPAAEGFRQATRDSTHDPIHKTTSVELDLVHRLAQIKHVPFLEGTNLTILAEILRSCDPRRLEAGEAVWREGDPIDELVLLLEGRAHSEGPSGIHHAPAGATLGAWELFSEEPRIESWIAGEPCRIVSVSRALFIDLLEDHFEFSQAYLRRTSQGIVDAWDALARRRARERRS